MIYYLLVENGSNEIKGGPYDEAPDAPPGWRVVEALLGYPDTCDWSAERGGFVDRVPVAVAAAREAAADAEAPPLSALAMLVTRLLDRGVLTNEEASVILARDNGQG